MPTFDTCQRWRRSEPKVTARRSLSGSDSDNGSVTAYQALDVFCKKISEESGSHVVIGTFPMNYLNEHAVSVNETRAKARQVLMHILGDMRWKENMRVFTDLLSWKLMHAYDGNRYVLNLNGVTPDAQVAVGGSTSKKTATTTDAVGNSSRGIRVQQSPQL